MVVLGIILLIVGLLAHIGLLFWIGVVLAVVGAVLLVAGPARVGRRYY